MRTYLIAAAMCGALAGATAETPDEPDIVAVPVPRAWVAACQQQGGCVLVSQDRLAEMIAEAVAAKRKEAREQCGRGA